MKKINNVRTQPFSNRWKSKENAAVHITRGSWSACKCPRTTVWPSSLWWTYGNYVIRAVRRQTRHSRQTGVKNQTGEKLVLGSVVCVALEAQSYPLGGESLRINWEVTHIMNARWHFDASLACSPTTPSPWFAVCRYSQCVNLWGKDLNMFQLFLCESVQKEVLAQALRRLSPWSEQPLQLTQRQPKRASIWQLILNETPFSRLAPLFTI